MIDQSEKSDKTSETTDAEILEVVRDIPLEELKAWADLKKREHEWEASLLTNGPVRIISPLEIRDRSGAVIDEVIKDRTSLLIKRQRKILAAIVPPFDGTSPPKNRIITARYLVENRRLLDEVSKGQKYWISRRNKIVAVLVPPPKSTEMYL